MSTDKKIIILGSGDIGYAVAEHLANKGQDAIILSSIDEAQEHRYLDLDYQIAPRLINKQESPSKTQQRKDCTNGHNYVYSHDEEIAPNMYKKIWKCSKCPKIL